MNKLVFEFEYQREAPISLFYVWYIGHYHACVKLLGMDPEPAKKVFSVYEEGVWKAYTQENNLDKIKESIENLSQEKLGKIVDEYLDDYNKFKQDKNLVFDKAFIRQLIAGFVVMFIVGDMQGHDLQAKALEARQETEEVFYEIWQALKAGFNQENFEVYDYDEILNGKILTNEEVSLRKKCLLTPDSVIVYENSEQLGDYLTREAIVIKKDPLVFEKSISRDWCLINIELHQGSFVREFKKQLGWGFTEVIYEGKDNQVTVYNPTVEYFDGMRNFVLSKLETDVGWLDQQADIIVSEVSETEKYLQKVGDKNLSEYTKEELLEIVNNFISRNYNIWPRFLMFVMFPMQMEKIKSAQYRAAVNKSIMTRKSIENAGPLLEDFGTALSREVARLSGVDDNLARYLSYNEILSFLKQEKLPSGSVLKQRQEYYLVTNEGVLLESLKSYISRKSYILREIEVGVKDEIKGSPAYSGNITGNVCKVLNKQMFDKFKEGDVLVTSMTTPDYLPIMKKASAFITDEGGITCHAAIVARELRKPCIIGTKIATQVLKDGDEVEVDANEGVVRIIKKFKN